MRNVIADKETCYKPTRTLPTIWFCLVPYDIGILMTFQRSSNSYRSPYRTDLSCYFNDLRICNRDIRLIQNNHDLDNGK